MTALIRTWGVALISASVVGGIFSSLIPDKSIGRTLRMLLGIYLAFVILSPLAGASLELPELEELDLAGIDAGSGYDEAVLRETARILENELGTRLTAAGIGCRDIEVAMQVDSDGAVSCASVRVTADPALRGREGEIAAVVLEVCGVQPEVKYAPQEGD